MLNVNNNVNLQFDMRTKCRVSRTTQEDDEEKYSNQENINRGLTDFVEPSSDANQNTHSNDVVGNGASHGISHRISQSSGESYLDSRSSISVTPYGNQHGSEGGRSVENGTARVDYLSGRSSIGNDTISLVTSSGNCQEKFQPITYDPTSIVRNKPFIENNYQCSIGQKATARRKKQGTFSIINYCVFAQICWKTLGNIYTPQKLLHGR